jgi:hypothetical protein
MESAEATMQGISTGSYRPALNVSFCSIYRWTVAAIPAHHRLGVWDQDPPRRGSVSDFKEAFMTTVRFTIQEAQHVAEALGLDLTQERFDVEQFRMGMDVELEHGRRDPQTNVTNDDPVTTGRIALAHLRELPDYYTRLAAMEGESGT